VASRTRFGDAPERSKRDFLYLGGGGRLGENVAVRGAINRSELRDPRCSHARPNSRQTIPSHAQGGLPWLELFVEWMFLPSLLEAFVAPKGATGCFHNTVEGITALLEFCQQQQVELVAMEATGGYEKKQRRGCGRKEWEWRCGIREGTGVCEVTGAAGEDRSDRCPSDRPVCGSKKV